MYIVYVVGGQKSHFRRNSRYTMFNFKFKCNKNTCNFAVSMCTYVSRDGIGLLCNRTISIFSIIGNNRGQGSLSRFI